MSPRVAELDHRVLIRIAGADARGFLDRLVTADLDRIAPGAAGYGALLTPQGKILADFLLVPLDGGVLVDAPASAGPDLLKRLAMYRLRAAVTIEDVTDRLAVLAVWDTEAAPAMPGHTVRDPRHPALGWRAYVARTAAGAAAGLPGAVIADTADFAAHRASTGIVESGADYPAAELFPHDAGLDQIGAVDFSKGCYVGQEVVSRMQHRGTARRRPVVVRGSGALPPPGTPLSAGGRPVGTLGTAAGADGVAIVRLDRARAAMDAGVPILAGDVAVTLELPAWIATGWPAAGTEDA